jgi:choline dehydrogenase-like flavoprotein
MDPSDFESHPWLSTTGWPISYNELLPFYREAARLCQLESTDPAAEGIKELPAVYQPPFIGNDVETATWQASPPTKFGKVYRSDLESASNITVYTSATAVEVLSDESGDQATGVRVASSTGASFEIAASTVVLCAGAIESARLLLASRGARPKGLGNDHDLVGRYFMEHPHLVTARLELLPTAVTNRPSLDAIDRGVLGTRARLAMQRPTGSAKVAYVIDDARRRRDQLSNFSTHIRTVSKVDREESEAYQAFKLVVNNMRSPSELASQVRSGAIPEGASEQAKRMVRGLPEILQVIYQEALKRPSELALYTQSEQVPNPESRVTLDEDRIDASGLPRVQLNWQLSRRDKESIMGAHEILAEQFATSGLGVLLPEPAFLDDGPDWGPGLRGGHHHMGTARMADDARHGVVDRDGQVHDVHGLYVGDAAVFPTAGYANPLLTMVALSWRLGAHLRVRHG